MGAADDSLSPGYRRYRHILCNHIEDLIPANVRNSQIACKICVQEKHRKEASEQGLTILNRVNLGGYSYLLPCHHEQYIHITAVRSGQWMCRQCNESYFDKPSQLYLLKLTDGNLSWLKMGYTNNLKVRVRSYKLPDHVAVEIMKLVSVKSGKEAIVIEQTLHSKYFKSRLQPEGMKKHHRQDGYTECYPFSMLQCLLTELNNVEKEQNET